MAKAKTSPKTPAKTTPPVVNIKCSMTIKDVAVRRALVANIATYEEMGRLEAKERKYDQHQTKLRALMLIIDAIAAFCEGEVYGCNIAERDELENLDEDIVLSIAKSVAGSLEDEVKKSVKSLPPSFRVAPK